MAPRFVLIETQFLHGPPWKCLRTVEGLQVATQYGVCISSVNLRRNNYYESHSKVLPSKEALGCALSDSRLETLFGVWEAEIIITCEGRLFGLARHINRCFDLQFGLVIFVPPSFFIFVKIERGQCIGIDVAYWVTFTRSDLNVVFNIHFGIT